jgi:sporulation protein YlmC with PRC-barrel domain
VTSATEQPKTDSDAAATTAPAQPAPGETTATTTPADQPAVTAKPGDAAGMSTPNLAGSFLASSFIGQTVYSGADENVGEINDIVVGKDKGTIFAVVGVGGFLGIGEKDVAVPMENIQVNKDANNNMKLVISLSREQLEASPAFDRTAALGE